MLKVVAFSNLSKHFSSSNHCQSFLIKLALKTMCAIIKINMVTPMFSWYLIQAYKYLLLGESMKKVKCLIKFYTLDGYTYFPFSVVLISYFLFF